MTYAVRLGTDIAGWTCLVIGAVLFPLPGPGILLIALGFGLLARHNRWARSWLDRVQSKALDGARASVATRRRAAWAVACAFGPILCAVLWLWSPEPAAWWPLPSWTWLPGGRVTGLFQLATGLAALGLIAYAWRRYRPER